MINNYKSWFFEKVDKYLLSKDLKKTSQRSIIMNKLLDKGGHISAEELSNELKEDGHRIGLATIYRTLRVLKDSGVIEEHCFMENRSLFELHFPDKHHDHIVCTSCGLVIEFLNNEIESLQQKVARENNFTLTKHIMNLYGKCEKCQMI